MSFSRNIWMVVKGITSVITVQVSDGDGNAVTGVYTGQEQLVAFAWPGDDQAQSFQLTPTWNNGATGAALGLIDLVAQNTSTSSLDDGVYHWLVQLADSSAALAEGELQISGIPGDGLPGLPDLASLTYVQSALSSISLNQPQIEYLPFAVNSASNMVRKYCNRNFTRQTYTQYSVPSLDGLILLGEMPINGVSRISTQLDGAIQVTASESAFQIAYLTFTTTGDYADSDSPLECTGIELHSVSSGVASSTPITFATNPTIQSLADAIGAVPGWTATVTSGYAAWPTSEIYCQGTGQGALFDAGVTLQVFSQDTQGSVDRRTGMLSLGNGYTTTGFGPRWGPDWLAFDFPSLYPFSDSVVRVIYNAGFDVIPPIVQQAVAEISKAMITRFKVDEPVKKESIGDYSYELFELMEAIPQPVRQGLSLYRITNA